MKFLEHIYSRKLIYERCSNALQWCNLTNELVWHFWHCQVLNGQYCDECKAYCEEYKTYCEEYWYAARATLLSPKNGQGVPRFRILTNRVGAKLIWFRSLAASLKLPIFWQTPFTTLVTKFDSGQKVKVGNKYWKGKVKIKTCIIGSNEQNLIFVNEKTLTFLAVASQTTCSKV